MILNSNSKFLLSLLLMFSGCFAMKAQNNGEFQMISIEEPVPVNVNDSTTGWPWRINFTETVETPDTTPAVQIPVKIAVILSDISANKDLEFARGMLMGLENQKNENHKISLRMINGAVSADSVRMQLDEFSPILIVANFEKNFPAYLSNYASDNNVMTVNAFDMRNEFYKNNPKMIQLLTPSNYFNQEISEFIGKNFEGYQLVTLGDFDPNDQMYDRISAKFPIEIISFPDLKDFAQFTPDPEKNYLFYCFPNKKENVKAVNEALISFRSKNPGILTAAVGRPSWITYTDFAKNFEAANVYIPSRCYFDPTTAEGKKFIMDYNKVHGHTPIKSFPVYSVMGYDLINHFVNGIEQSGNDYTKEWPKTPVLQNEFSFKNAPGVAGYYNPEVYIIRFNSTGGADKISIN